MSGLNYGNKYCLVKVEKTRRQNGNPNKKKTIYVFNEKEKLINKYSGFDECCIEEKISETTIRNCIRKRKLLKGKYYSHNKTLQPNSQLF